MPELTDPLTLPCGLKLSNRIVKAAMTEGLSDADNNATPKLDRLYQRFASGGAGLVITGNVMVDRRHLERARNVVADEVTDREALRRWAVSTGSTPTLVQLSHPGRQTNRLIQPQPLAPSRTEPVGLAGMFARPRAMSLGEIAKLRRRFVSAAELLVGAGFDGVQVHAAHGYLLSSFLSPRHNQRHDQYGGDLAGRARLLLEIVADLRAALPTTAAIGVKINSSDDDPPEPGAFDDLVQVAGWLLTAGADLLEISGGHYESPALLGLNREKDVDAPETYFADAAKRVSDAVDLPVMLIGGFTTRETMEETLSSGTAALIGVARPLAVRPELAGQLLAGEIDELPRPAPRLGGPQAVQRLLGMAANTGWHALQMERHAGSLRPPRVPAVAAAADYAVREGVFSLLLRRRLLAAAQRVERQAG